MKTMLPSVENAINRTIYYAPDDLPGGDLPGVNGKN